MVIIVGFLIYFYNIYRPKSYKGDINYFVQMLFMFMFLKFILSKLKLLICIKSINFIQHIQTYAINKSKQLVFKGQLSCFLINMRYSNIETLTLVICWYNNILLFQHGCVDVFYKTNTLRWHFWHAVRGFDTQCWPKVSGQFLIFINYIM